VEEKRAQAVIVRRVITANWYRLMRHDATGQRPTAGKMDRLPSSGSAAARVLQVREDGRFPRRTSENSAAAKQPEQVKRHRGGRRGTTGELENRRAPGWRTSSVQYSTQ
jgi:hypothetical protein